MHILFLDNHPRWIYGLPNGFRHAGHEVEVLQTLNEKSIMDVLLEFKPNLIMSIGWKSKSDVEVLQKARKYIRVLKIPYIYWATEDPGYTHVFTMPFIQKTNPDFIFTICHEKVEYYEKLKIKSEYLDFGYDESIHCPVKCEREYKSQVSVVANAYPELLKKYPKNFRLKSLINLITPIINSKIPIGFWGQDWDKMDSILGCTIPKECIRGYIPYTEANKVYSSSDIVIGIQNQEKLPQLCQRTYEILGSGGFLLTSDTPRVRELFKTGEDLIISASPEETIKLVGYYLNRPDERRKIQANGKKTVEMHNYKYRAEYIINVLKKRNIIF
ncbi:CgeB family protein [Clostridium lundense]|uniref:CgeB family protein n=1 Tax=Clostridium lundense TaxID=319475 RepID=UPI00054FD20B|nr:glycosyltransferase [Clostridium lundense]